jgi:hypothetical protein
MQWHIDAQKLFDAKEFEVDQQGLTPYECPCTCCHGGRQQIGSTIKKHLRLHGQDPFFQWPMVVLFKLLNKILKIP